MTNTQMELRNQKEFEKKVSFFEDKEERMLKEYGLVLDILSYSIPCEVTPNTTSLLNLYTIAKSKASTKPPPEKRTSEYLN